MEVADDDSRQTTNERLAAADSALISNYILARLLGTSPARIPSDILLPPGIPFAGFPQLPPVPFPAVPRAAGEVTSQLISPEPDVAVDSNKSTHLDVDDDNAESSEMKEDSVDSSDVGVRRAPASSLHQRHHRLDVNKAQQMLMEWNGDRGKARSVSNAAANFVVFAPLSPGRAVPRPEVVRPTATYDTLQVPPPPPSTEPNNISSLRAIVEKSLGDEHDVSRADDGDVSGNTSTAEQEAFKSGPAAADIFGQQVEDIGHIAQDRDYVTPVTGFHLQPRLFPGAEQPRGDTDKLDRTAPFSLLLPPVHDPWTISEDPKLTASDEQFPASNDGLDLDEGNFIKSTLRGRESDKVESRRDSGSNVATTDPTVYMYTVLTRATSPPSDDEEHHDIDDVRNDVMDEDDVEYDVGEDIGHNEKEDDVESQSTEGSYEDETSPTEAADIRRRLSPEFLSVMRSLWPGLEICAGPQCNNEDTTDERVSSSDVDDKAAGLRQNTEYDLSIIHTASTESVTLPGMRAGDITVTSRPATTPSSWQVSASTSSQTDTATTSLHQTLASHIADHQLTVTRRNNVELDEIADSEVNMTSHDNDDEEGLKSTVMSTTASGIQLMDNMHDREFPGGLRRHGSLAAGNSMSPSRPVNSSSSRPVLSVPATQRLEEPIRGRPFYHHPLRADPTRREQSRGDIKERPFRQRHAFLPPIFSFHRNPTIIKPRPRLRGVSNRRRVQTVDNDSELVRKSEAVSQENEDTLIRHYGSSPLIDDLLRNRGVFESHDIDRKELLGSTTTSALTGKLTSGVKKTHSEASLLATLTEGKSRDATRSDKTKDSIVRSESPEDKQEKIEFERTTHRSGSRESLSSSDKDREQNVDEGSRTTQLSTSKASSSPWQSDVVTAATVSEQSKSRTTMTTVTSRRPLHSVSTERQQTISDEIDVPLISTSSLPAVLEAGSAEITTTVTVQPMSAVSAGGGEPLPVQARPGEHGRSAAAIAMLGGYADWMVGLISAVAVAVFIFLAILSFLAVVSCRCVSSR